MALFVALAACGAPPPATGINDPNERRNRAVHEFNKGLDTVLVRPASQVYGVVVPEPARGVVSNFAENLGLPSAILNNTLQGDLPSAAQNSGRFIVNSVVGIGGLFDPAGELGVEAIDTDFGETLHVWGAGEGTYVEAPFFGPSTARDTVGRVAGFVLDPVNAILRPPASLYGTGANVADALGSRYRFDDTINSLLYDSADSYAQARLAYLQNRRFELGQDAPAGASDPTGDLYDDLYFE